MIILNKLSTIDLRQSYARKLDENRIRQYSVPYAKILAGDKNADELVKEYVTKETGETVVIQDNVIKNAFGISPFAVQEAKDLLLYLPKIKKQLEKQRVKSTVLQYDVRDPWYKYILNPIAIVWNWIAIKINTTWSNNQWSELGGFPKTKLGPRGLFALRDRIKSIPLMPLAGWRRHATLCRFLNVTFDESNRNEAVKILQNDLKILADNKLIMGHLSMPFQLQLADTVGSGELSYVLACFLFVDDVKIEKLVGKQKYKEYGHKAMGLNSLLGLKTESTEGGLGNVDLRKKYIIEEINICEGERKSYWDAYLKSYEEYQEALKKNAEIICKKLPK